MQPVALVDGLRGQDGSLLAKLLIHRGYKVHGCIRRSSRGLDLGCAQDLQGCPNLEVNEIDLLDQGCLTRLTKLAKPELWFHVAAQSHVGTSFEQPLLTLETNATGTLNCLEAIRNSGIHTRFLNCATSEMYGGVSSEPANELTPFHPRSPYGVSKLAAYWMTINYRESYKMFACSSICFNHEGPTRGPNFVTRKITLTLADIIAGRKDKLFLGNLAARRDWGWAEDYCDGMIRIITSAYPEDYVLATGETHTVREFCEIAFSLRGLDYQKYVEVDPTFFRPAEVNVLIGDASKIKRELAWIPQVGFRELVKRMVDHDCPEVTSDQNT